MMPPPIRKATALPDDVFRERLAETIAALEAWAADNGDVAEIEMAVGAEFWKIRAVPHMTGACPFEILLRTNQTFSVNLASEVYEDRRIDRFDFFAMFARAVTLGNVERIETLSAATGAREMIEMRVDLEDGWAWIGERRVAPRNSRKFETNEVCRLRRFLSYRRD